MDYFLTSAKWYKKFSKVTLSLLKSNVAIDKKRFYRELYGYNLAEINNRSNRICDYDLNILSLYLQKAKAIPAPTAHDVKQSNETVNALGPVPSEFSFPCAPFLLLNNKDFSQDKFLG